MEKEYHATVLACRGLNTQSYKWTLTRSEEARTLDVDRHSLQTHKAASALESLGKSRRACLTDAVSTEAERACEKK